QKITRIKADAFHTTIENRKERIELSKPILQIIETYLKRATFSTANEPGTIAELIPFSKLGDLFGLREDWARQTASSLFNNKILVRYFLSHLLGFDPEILLEGDELSLHGNAQQYLYARRETLQPSGDMEKDSETRLYRLYIPEVSKQTIQQIGFRIIKRLHYAPPPLIQVAHYNFKQSCWKTLHLPEIHKIF
ncbi:MAG: hypothetical protein ACFFCQ_13595, partial [Promethearchaeota archaeon]